MSCNVVSEVTGVSVRSVTVLHRAHVDFVVGTFDRMGSLTMGFECEFLGMS